jgi:hypothetical protein
MRSFLLKQALRFGVFLLFVFSIQAQAFAAPVIRSVWAAHPPRLDGTVQSGEWDQADANRFKLDHGWLLIQNDASYLYLLIDLTLDINDDPQIAEAPGDFLSLAFDLDLDRKITPKTDVMYGLSPAGSVGFQYYLEPSLFTTLQATGAKIVRGFGPSPYSATPHRIWEVSIPLSEVKACPGRPINLGLRTFSRNPSFDDNYPRDFMTSFSELPQLMLAEQAPQPETAAATSSPPQTEPIQRTVLPDGTIELRYPNGDVKRIYRDRITITHPNGIVESASPLEVQLDAPPSAPRGQLRRWLDAVNGSLLDNIKRLLCRDEAVISAYLAGESSSSLTSVYAQIAFRTNFINRLAAEPIQCTR